MNLFSRNVSRFAHVPERDGFEILSYDKLPEDDFDFLAETNKGTKYVELVEIRPEGKDGYEKYKEKITVGEFSDFVLSVLEKKEQKLYQSD